MPGMGRVGGQVALAPSCRDLCVRGHLLGGAGGGGGSSRHSPRFLKPLHRVQHPPPAEHLPDPAVGSREAGSHLLPRTWAEASLHV